jgi:hypothetical protein
MSRLLPPPFPHLQRGTECESDAVPCELQWLEGEEGDTDFAGNELA